MSLDKDLLAALTAKEEIRELVHFYSRAVDRTDEALLADLYAKDGVDNHGDMFRGSATDYVAWLAARWAARKGKPGGYGGHHVCNHLISVDGKKGEGEVYALAWHVFEGEGGALVEHIYLVRYLDKYRREKGRWRFARRDVTFDVHLQRPFGEGCELDPPAGENDLSYQLFTHRLFGRGARA